MTDIHQRVARHSGQAGIAEAIRAALEFSRRRAAAGPSPLGIHVFMGADWPTMTANSMRNLAEDRIRSRRAVLERI